MLIVFSGLPGTGKTAIARDLVVRLPGVYLRIDAIEHALLKTTALEVLALPAMSLRMSSRDQI